MNLLQPLHDLRRIVRSLGRTPGFAVAAIFTLALGVAATTVVFSIVDSILLNPVPFRDPDRLVEIYRWGPTGGGPFQPIAMLPRWREQSEIFEQVEAHWEGSYALTGDEKPEVIYGSQVTVDMLDLLGVSPAFGRDFAANESDQPVALISDSLWKNRFDADPDILGRTVQLTDDVFTIIGVMPAWFNFPVRNIHVWMPYDPLKPNPLSPRRGLTPIARLRGDITLEQANARVAALAPQLDESLAPSSQASARLQTMNRYAANSIMGGSASRRNVRTALFLLLGAAGLVLLASCANSANLFLSRALSRTHEIAIRAAIGGSRMHLARFILSEAIVIAILAGVFGLLLAGWIVRGIELVIPPDLIEPTLNPMEVNGRAILCAVVASLAAGLIAAAIPTFGVLRSEITNALKGTPEHRLRGNVKFRGFLIAVETAVAFVLVTGAGLMAQSLWTLNNVDTGLFSDGVFVIEPQFQGKRYGSAAARARFMSDLDGRLKSMSSVRDTALAQWLPMLPATISFGMLESDRSTIPDSVVRVSHVSSSYFDTLGIPLRIGRTFEPAGNLQQEAIIAQAAAERLWPGEDPIGKRFRMESIFDWLTVVAVAGDVRSENFDDPTEPFEIYRPFQANAAGPSARYLAAKAVGGPGVAGVLRDPVRQLDPNLAVNIRPMADIYSETLAKPRFHAILIGGLAVLTALLAVAGLYAVVAYEVSRKTKDFGIRVALGASSFGVMRHAVGRSMVVAIVGIGLGAACSVMLTQLMSSMLYEVRPGDPLTFAGSALLLLAAAAVACYVPARRALQVDPIVALRHE